MSTSLYKGKTTNRSWQQLPPEIIRLIATHHLLQLPYDSYCPQIWLARENWLPKIIYTVLRDTLDVERLMAVCPSWSLALESHFFWQHACSVIDPQNALAHHAVIRSANANANRPQLIRRLTPYRHFRNIINCSCYVCRINSPYTPAGLGMACKRPISTPFLPCVPICKEHRKHTFCGLCLCEAVPLESESDTNAVCCVENEDEETWPGVEATCRTCREEWLWRRVSPNSRDREAVGGPTWESPDWETRQRIDAFIELGDGTVAEVVQLAREKHWLRRFTKLNDMLSQAVAASRFANREEKGGLSYASSEDGSTLEEEEDDEKDYELMGLTGDMNNLRNLAIIDWARNRILDGFWTSPADQWYGHTVNGHLTAVRAVHPCPWNAGDDAHLDGQSEHPRPETVQGEIPPSFHLCEQSYIFYQRQMHSILYPAMTNIVRRIVIECTADGIDPVIRASRMAVEDVANELRDVGVWYNGIDWLERRRNVQQEREAQERVSRQDRYDGDDTSSSKSDSSDTTSPVLSTSTLQTSPSPPPSESKLEKAVGGSGSAGRQLPIAVSPVLKSPELIHPIPYIPVTLSHLPIYSIESFKAVWRDACAPLYHCKCTICERATVNANAGLASPNQVKSQRVATPLSKKLAEIHNVDALKEEEEEAGEGGTQQPAEEEDGGEESEETSEAEPEARWPPRRKRSSAELEGAEAGSASEAGSDGRGGKRARRVPRARVRRVEKRGSEELEDECGEAGRKRRRAGEDGESALETAAVKSSEDGSEP